MPDALERFLQQQHHVVSLLAQDATEADLRAALEVAHADASEFGLRAHSDRLGEAVLHLHRSRAEDQRHTAGLAALIDTVTDLATHRDLDVLLRAICRRARTLLSTDVAYIMLTDPSEGDCHVHTTDGIVSEAFRTMRVDAGIGIGGRVAATGQPETTPDYHADARLRHSGDVDDRVAAEGLHGVAAAPMRRGAHIMGVLFACSRTTRRFEAREIALLAALADHAAVAIDNARLLREAQQSTVNVAAAEARTRAHAERVESVGRARDRLAALALDGASVPELLEATLAFVPGSLEAEVPHIGLRYAQRSPGAGAVGRLVEVGISAGEERLGTIRLWRADRDGTEEEILTYAAGLAANALLRQQVRSEADLRGRALILESLIEGRGDEEDVDRLLGQMGVSADEPLVVSAWALPVRRTRWAWLEVARAAAAQRSVAATAGGHIFVIGPGDDAEGAAQRWHAQHREKHSGEPPPTIGAAVSLRGARGLPDASDRAKRVLGILAALGRSGAAGSAERLGILGHLLDADARPDLGQFVQRTLEALDDHDAATRAPLVPVVEAFIANDGHLARTARALHVHINTLYRRLERVDGLLGSGWRAGDQRLELALALRLRGLERRLLETAAADTVEADVPIARPVG
jgi:GAF domain-containing protein